MIRMLIVGCCFGIRSERRLCEEVRLKLAYRWFCRLDREAFAADQTLVNVFGAARPHRAYLFANRRPLSNPSFVDDRSWPILLKNWISLTRVICIDSRIPRTEFFNRTGRKRSLRPARPVRLLRWNEPQRCEGRNGRRDSLSSAIEC
jgi:hypothetical protein